MDVESFKRLFLPLHPKLFRIAYALVENKSDAEDILQDAYYKLWSRRNELADVRNPEAFCVTRSKIFVSISFVLPVRAGMMKMSPKSSPSRQILLRTKNWKCKIKWSKSAISSTVCRKISGKSSG